MLYRIVNDELKVRKPTIRTKLHVIIVCETYHSINCDVCLFLRQKLCNACLSLEVLTQYRGNSSAELTTYFAIGFSLISRRYGLSLPENEVKVRLNL